MTRFVRVVLALAVLCGASLAQTTTPAGAIPSILAAQQDPKAITVYVTRTGAKYHRDACRYLSRSRIPMSLAEAAKRFGPCRVCKPPVIE